ncbi:hypothetical protein GCM10023151_19620 [Kangiella marina]|uniref:Uncharacterized protein n=1 Tax=Kangiella marina TaxID=1079178 RepID=A0ABP8IN27_9GAMM
MITLINFGLLTNAPNSCAIDATKNARSVIQAPKLMIKPRLKTITSGGVVEKCLKASPIEDIATYPESEDKTMSTTIPK